MAFGLSAGAVSLIGAGAGLLASKKGNNTTTTTADRSPWAPAQQYLIDNLATNKQLQGHYEQNPFNQTQKQGYQGMLGDVDNMRQNIAPGLMNFANNMMTGSYKRPQYSRPGMAGYGGSPAADQSAGGLLASGNNRPGPFSVAAQPAFGQIDWNASNPFFKTPEQQAEAKAAAAALAEQERLRLLAAQQPAYDYESNRTDNLG